MFNIFDCFILDRWILVQAGKVCKGEGIWKSHYTTLEECAEMVYGESAMFSFGRNRRCSVPNRGTVCACYAQVTATDGYCEEVVDDDFNLFKFPSKNGKRIQKKSNSKFEFNLSYLGSRVDNFRVFI